MKYFAFALAVSLAAVSLAACATTEEKAPTGEKQAIVEDIVTRDTDGDGIPDVTDNCPGVKGSEINNGCAVPQLVRLKADRVEILEKVYFATDSDQIEERSFKLLDNVATVLKVHPDMGSIRIEGHTDNTGDHDYNVDLSKRRATSVMTYLTEKGVAAARLSAEGFGPDKPLGENDTDEGRANNRRVEFIVVKG